jgi:hypothetical protein
MSWQVREEGERHVGVHSILLLPGPHVVAIPPHSQSSSPVFYVEEE